MLISFSLENWKSFKEKVTISTIASKQRTHRDRVSQIKRYKAQIIPILALYGGNASGKSNICAALQFARDIIVKGTKTRDEKIDVQPFLLCPGYDNKPSGFWFEILAEECIYEFYFTATKDEICEERLTKIKPTRDQTLYERKSNKTIINEKDKKNKNHLNYIAQSTRINQLFLTNTIESNNNTYQTVYDWFSDVLRVISPGAKYSNPEYLIDKKHPFYDEANSIIRQLDTGILRLGSEVEKDIDLEKVDVEKDTFLSVLEGITNERYIKSLQNGKEQVKKLISYHTCEDGKEIPFDLKIESSGTKRLLDLLPAFISGKTDIYDVFIIDEIDRSLHHLLVRHILESYLNTCNKNTRTQIIFTTHDLLLMDQELLRRDEISVIERDNRGVSTIIPLNDYKGVRKDKDILKSYLQGRFGGIPRI